ncbi:MAG: AAA family ATPase [Desulfobulbaceae bacterium]|nr:AAA family ATPase [Desulfobulbaceae bacterium]
MKNNIIITGFMGVGKSRTARALAASTGLFALDTDDLIESITHSSISAFFAAHGEPAFRALEQQVANWIESSVDHTIVSTGGGFFMVENILDLGHVFFLDADFDAIYKRLLAQPGNRQIAKRPLFQDPDQARKRYYDRLPLYRKNAHYILKTEGRESSVIALQIRDILRSKGLLPVQPDRPFF